MQRTPLYQFHVENGAKLVDFAGWEMPMMYTGIIQEHQQVRASGGLFDVSHMGRLKITGRHARRFLERACTRRVSDMEAGQCRYSLVCNERGGVRDDVIVYRMDDDEFYMVVNGANREKIVAHFEQVKAAGELALKIEDATLSTAMVALQGPKVMSLVSRFSSEIPTLKRYRFTVKNLMIMKLIVSRTGYTGEDGVEVILPAGAVGMAMSLMLRDVNVKSETSIIRPAGLGARDSLRMEAGMPLYGHELGEEINALECGVDFAISLDKDQGERGETFIGMEALKQTVAQGGPRRRLVGLALDGKRTARQGNPILAAGGGGKPVGEVTSGCLSPTLGHAIAMGFVETAHTVPGAALQVDTGRGLLEGKVAKLPFYKAPKA
ncbi:MAG: glycine cleavage system aminomethyltransferase GcvT [Phycisphaerales bacterium]